LKGYENTNRAIMIVQKQVQGKLKITDLIPYGEGPLAPFINDFLLQYPALDVNLQLSNQKVDLIDEGYDLAIRLGQLEDSSMMAKRLGSRTQYVCASEKYLSTHGVPYSLSELNHHNCLQGTLDYWRFQENGKHRNIRIKGNLRCNSGHALTDAALKGLGIVQLPDYYVQEYIDNQQLIPLMTQFTESDEGIWALYPHNRHLSPKVRMLVDFLSEQLN